MAEFGFELEDIARLIKLVESRELSELIVEEEGRRVVIRGARYVPPRPASAPMAAPVAAGAEMIVAPVAGAPAPAAPAPQENRIAVESPMIGVFYRAAGPDTPSFVEVGDHVDVGQTIGLIEAMKVFSEVPSEVAGTVVEIPVQNGKLVRVGEPLVFLRPD